MPIFPSRPHAHMLVPEVNNEEERTSSGTSNYSLQTKHQEKEEEEDVWSERLRDGWIPEGNIGHGGRKKEEILKEKMP